MTNKKEPPKRGPSVPMIPWMFDSPFTIRAQPDGDRIRDMTVNIVPGPVSPARPTKRDIVEVTSTGRRLVGQMYTRLLKDGIELHFKPNKPIPTPMVQAVKIIRDHFFWYLRHTGRADIIPRVTERIIEGLTFDAFGRAGCNMYGIHHRDYDRQVEWIRARCKTRVSRLYKFCHTDLMEWFVTHRIMAPAVNSVWELDWEDD